MRDTIASLDLEAGGEVLVATVEGEIDSSNAAELRLALSERLPSAASALVLDLSQVTYLDSAGVHLIFELGRRLAARRQAIRLVIGLRSPIRRVLEMCAVEAVAPIDFDREASLGAVAAAAISARD
jgi:anti-anti-sigma factor